MTKILLGGLLLLGEACGSGRIESDRPPSAAPPSTRPERLDTSTTLYYEGSCAWLACASVYCGMPGCGNACSDGVPWVARPDTSIACESTVHICNLANGLCVDATVEDTSSGGVWEANQAVFDALGASYHDGTCGCAPCTGITTCGGTYGGGSASVTISDGSGSTGGSGGGTTGGSSGPSCAGLN